MDIRRNKAIQWLVYIMLVDDIMTPGATSNECSKQLIRAGASRSVVLTLARAAALQSFRHYG